MAVEVWIACGALCWLCSSNVCVYLCIKLVEHTIKQNNAVDIYEEYFVGADDVGVSGNTGMCE